MVFVPCTSTQGRYVGDLRETVAYLTSARGMSLERAMREARVPVSDRAAILAYVDSTALEESIRASEGGGTQRWEIDLAGATSAGGGDVDAEWE